MKSLIAILLGLVSCLNLYSQRNEFKVHSNGLIYSEQTMNKLSHIVDSLNLKFKSCDLNKVFYSVQQTCGHVIKLDTGDIKAARKDLESQISLQDFFSKYPQASMEKDILILRSKYKNYNDEEIVEVEHFDVTDSYGFSVRSEDLALYERKLQHQWLFEYFEKTNYSKEYLMAFYFPNEFTSPPLPKRYAQMIGYADCLIDTTTTKFKEDSKSGWVELPKNWASLPERKKEALLEEMRSTRVIGFCSQDSRPRQHAVHIALLSAETAHWEVFLKAHLDIMNDRFERMTDGSYAWAQRETYIKELEELDIDVLHLLFGTALRIENPAQNHYFGSIGRIGRALSETENRKEIEDAMLSAIADVELDDYNRVLFYFLFQNYNHHIDDETVRVENQNKLKEAAIKLPDYLSSRLLSKE